MEQVQVEHPSQGLPQLPMLKCQSRPLIWWRKVGLGKGLWDPQTVVQQLTETRQHTIKNTWHQARLNSNSYSWWTYLSTRAWTSSRLSYRYSTSSLSSRQLRKKREEDPLLALSKSHCPLATGIKPEELLLQHRNSWKETQVTSANTKWMPFMDQMAEVLFLNRRALISSNQLSTQATIWASTWEAAVLPTSLRAPTL